MNMPKEGAGSSTIAEMLAMLSYFPRKRRNGVCMEVQVRLRLVSGCSRVTLAVLSANGKEESCREIPMENAWVFVEAGPE